MQWRRKPHWQWQTQWEKTSALQQWQVLAKAMLHAQTLGPFCKQGVFIKDTTADNACLFTFSDLVDRLTMLVTCGKGRASWKIESTTYVL